MEHCHNACDSCCHHVSSHSTVQTLDEMEFEKGIWTAALDGDTDRVQRFLSKPGFNVDVRDQAGYTALHYSARKGNLSICRLLVSHGADVNAQTRSCGSTPLHRAAYQGHTQIVAFLLDNGAEPLEDCDGMTPLHKAAQNNRLEVCKLLVNKFSWLSGKKDTKGRSAVELALSPEVVSFLKC